MQRPVSTLGGGLNQLFIDRGKHQRLLLSSPDPHSTGKSQSAYRVSLKALEEKVQALLQAAQQERKTALEGSRVDATFQVGNQALLQTAELLDAAVIGQLRPPWAGPFRATALTRVPPASSTDKRSKTVQRLAEDWQTADSMDGQTLANRL